MPVYNLPQEVATELNKRIENATRAWTLYENCKEAFERADHSNLQQFCRLSFEAKETSFRRELETLKAFIKKHNIPADYNPTLYNLTQNCHPLDLDELIAERNLGNRRRRR